MSLIYVWCPSCRKLIQKLDSDKRIREALFYCTRCTTSFVFTHFEVYEK